MKGSSWSLVFALVLLLGHVEPAAAFVDVVVGSLIGFLFGELFKEYVAPVGKLLLAGPTGIISHALAATTPFLKTSVLGERFNQFFYTTISWVPLFAANAIAKIVEQSITWSIDGTLIALQALLLPLDLIINKRELPPVQRSSQTAASLRGRHLGLTAREHEFGASGIDQLLEERPQLKEFLSSLSPEGKDCTREFLCTLYASPDAAVTPEERIWKDSFRAFWKGSRSAAAAPFAAAARLGQESGRASACAAAYPKCPSVTFFRGVLIFAQRVFHNYEKH